MKGKLRPSRMNQPVNCKYMTLAQVEVGQRAKILELRIGGPTRRRLLDLGLLPGTEISAAIRSPLGSPIAYEIRGSVLALRPEDSSKIAVKILP